MNSPRIVSRMLRFALGGVVVLFLSTCSSITKESSTSCSQPGIDRALQSPEVRKGDETLNFDEFIAQISDRDVVFIGESHDRYDHHLNQLEIICRLHVQDPDLVIALEFFQHPFQPSLDAYIDGQLSTDEMLEKTEYYDRWGYDYRLYEPILSYAASHGIPVLALNVPAELTRQIGRGGISALSEDERGRIPATIDRTDIDYRERLEAVFEQHPEEIRSHFEHFLEVQLVWDEGMAEAAAEFLRQHPGTRMVVLAGSGHFAFGSGVPNRLERRVDVDSTIVLQGAADASLDSGSDFWLVTTPIELPKPGLLGVVLDSDPEGLTVQSFGEDSAARTAGLQAGDRIRAVDGNTVQRFADLKIAIWRKGPGDKVTVAVERPNDPGSEELLDFDVVLR